MSQGSHSSINKTKAMHEALRQIPYNLFVVGVGTEEDEENAFVVSWAMQCSFEPPTVAVAVKADSISLKLIERHGAFTVNMLPKKRDDIARKLVKPHHSAGNKLGDVGHYFEETGAPILRDAIAFVECRVASIHKVGDHSLVTGEVINASQTSPEEPLRCSDLGWHYGG